MTEDKIALRALLEGSVRYTASDLTLGVARARIYAFCMIVSAMHVALAKRARR